MSRLRDDPQQFARELARPMPRRPSPEARFGTRFHAWVESRFGQPELIPYDELEGRADAGIDDESDLAELVARFESGPYADRVPHAVEAPFALVLAGQVVRGRIDAVYTEEVDGERGFVVVDWKTNRAATADPLQLAIYRLAWAELTAPRWSGCGRCSTTSGPVRRSRPTTSRAAPSWSASSARSEAGRSEQLALTAASRASGPSRRRLCLRSLAVAPSPVTTWSETVQTASALRPCAAASV